MQQREQSSTVTRPQVAQRRDYLGSILVSLLAPEEWYASGCLLSAKWWLLSSQVQQHTRSLLPVSNLIKFKCSDWAFDFLSFVTLRQHLLVPPVDVFNRATIFLLIYSCIIYNKTYNYQRTTKIIRYSRTWFQLNNNKTNICKRWIQGLVDDKMNHLFS